LVTLESSLFSEGTCGRELEVMVQVVEQSALILELDVDVGEYQVQSFIVGLECDGSNGACFGFGGALESEKSASQF